MPAVKGKQGTKGQKQIVADNASTLQMYLAIAGISSGLHFCAMSFIFLESFTAWYITLFLITGAIHMGSFQFMKSMAKATYDPTSGTLLDGGIDLNMESGMAENMKDLILLTAGVQISSLISSYFWLVLLLIPGRAFYMLWVNVLAPWFFAEAPEVDEKKEKKKERKMMKRR